MDLDEEWVLSDGEEEQDEYAFINNDQIDDEMLKPVYEKANITLCAAYCAILEFKRSCHLPFTAIKNCLSYCNYCVPLNILPKSVYMFKKFFTKFSSPLQKHQYCPNCKLVIENCTCDSQSSEPDSLITLDAEKTITRVVKSKHLI